jgi:hypothetical protein
VNYIGLLIIEQLGGGLQRLPRPLKLPIELCYLLLQLPNLILVELLEIPVGILHLPPLCGQLILHGLHLPFVLGYGVLQPLLIVRSLLGQLPLVLLLQLFDRLFVGLGHTDDLALVFVDHVAEVVFELLGFLAQELS